jgi:formate hydrogenlyase subunit 3/multisubunit Na+/H+ antiporter MnhD subunit
MGNLLLIAASVGVSLVGLLLILFLPSHRKSGLNLALVLINAVLTSVPAIHALTSGTVEFILPGSAFFGNIPIRIDALSAWFILIINFTSINGAWYGMGYMKPYKDEKNGLSLHWMLFFLFHSSMLWVCMLQHSLAFLVAWELMSLTSMLLVIFEFQQKNVLKAGINYLVQMHIGVVFLTVAFIWVYFSEGSFDFAAIGKFFNTNPNIWLFLLFFVGFGIKAGFIPLHTWLPQAHPAAPSHISGVMSGVIVKLGIYGILRVASYLKQDYLVLGAVVLILSTITGMFGIFNAAVHRNFKRMLAYCTIENIGIIGMGIGLGLIGLGNGNKLLVIAGFGGALLHTLNHSLFKSLLFFTAGSVYQQTHTKNMEKLGGLIKKMPQTAIFFLIGALAIGGLPPFNGFVSEFILYNGFLDGIKTPDFYQITLMVFAIASLAIIGGISILTFTKGFGTIFLGSARTHLHHDPQEVSLSMRLPQYLIVAVMISIGIVPQFYFTGAIHTVTSLFTFGNANEILMTPPVLGVISHIGIYSALFVALATFIYFIRNSVVKQHVENVNATWGCGYVAPHAGIQYTGKSFSKSLAKLLAFVVTEKKKYHEIDRDEIFPKERSYSSYYIDIFGTYINRATDRLLYFMNYFQFIQNGNIQAYILYGLIFIVVVFVSTLFKFI